MKKIIFCLLNILFLLLLFSCKKEQSLEPDPNPSISTPKGILKLHLHTFIGESEVDNYHLNYSDLNGRSISLSMAQLFISDIKLIRLDDSECSIAGKSILKFFESETSTVGEVPVGNYKSISFKVGLNMATVNDSSLLKETSMWFSNSHDSNKFIAFNFQGQIDTSSNLSGLLAPFCYKVANTFDDISITMPVRNFSVLKGQIQYIHMLIDYSQIFNGLHLNMPSNLNVSTINDNQTAVASVIRSNIPRVFRYE
jgi:hypothetical protein